MRSFKFTILSIVLSLFTITVINAQSYVVSISGSDPQNCDDLGTAIVSIIQPGQAGYHIAGGGGGWYGGGSAFAAGAGGGSSYIGGVQSGTTEQGINSDNGLLKLHFNDSTVTYNYTGAPQVFNVPANVSQLFIEAWGAQGGDAWACGGFYDEQGGKGGYSSGYLDVTSGESYFIYVGGAGYGPTVSNNTNSGGWNGGGDGNLYGAGGGGATDFRTTLGDLNSRLLVAGGGGGSNEGCPDHGEGGLGGGLTGGDGTVMNGSKIPGLGGTQTAGGAAGTNGKSGGFGFGGEYLEVVDATILWSTDETVPSITNLAPGNYSVKVTEPGGFVHDLSIVINTPPSGSCLQEQIIAFDSIATKLTSDDDFELDAIASSELPITYTSSDQNIASIIDGKVHIVSAGTCTIYANQAGNETFNVADQVSQTLTVLLDTDNDGIANNADTDDDGDGYSDEDEAANNTDSLSAESVPEDNDGDKISDLNDPDDDNDGVIDSEDAFPTDATETVDTDKDGKGNNADTDDDGDGYSDEDEAANNTDSLSAESVPEDNDGDKVSDLNDIDDDNDGVIDSEDAFPTNATETVDTDKDGKGNNADTDDDGDGYSDEDEAANNTDSLNAESVPEDNDGDKVSDLMDTDDDNDGVIDSEDAFPTDATETQDTDQDGKGDNADTDDDGDEVSDEDEIINGTDPKDADTDDDGVNDKEDEFPHNPFDSKDTDKDGIGDYDDGDDDNDGISDQEELVNGTDPKDADTDNDGVNDKEDAFALNSEESIDTDNDGVGNNEDTDDDNDGLLDEEDPEPLRNTTNVESIQSVNTNVYPSYGDGEINIHVGNQERFQLNVYDLAGRKVFSEENVFEKVVINLSEKPAGCYLIQIKQENKTISLEKVVIK